MHRGRLLKIGKKIATLLHLSTLSITALSIVDVCNDSQNRNFICRIC